MSEDVISAGDTSTEATAADEPVAAATDAAESIGSTLHERVVEPLKAAGEKLKEAGQKAAANASEISALVIDHAESNTREAFAALRAAAKAGTVTDVLKVQGEFVRDQGARSLQQAREIGELIAKFGRDAIAPLRRD
jgi:phasin family protein